MAKWILKIYLSQVFDCISKLAVKVVNRRAKKAKSNLSFSFSIGNPEKTISSWSEKLKVVDWFTMYGRTQLDPNWPEEIVKRIKASERLKIAKIVQVKFLY